MPQQSHFRAVALFILMNWNRFTFFQLWVLPILIVTKICRGHILYPTGTFGKIMPSTHNSPKLNLSSQLENRINNICHQDGRFRALSPQKIRYEQHFRVLDKIVHFLHSPTVHISIALSRKCALSSHYARFSDILLNFATVTETPWQDDAVLTWKHVFC